MNIKEARIFAEENYKILRSNFPASLKRDETKILKKIKRSNKSNLKKLKKLFSFMDEFYGFIHNYTPCEKKCSKCCFYSITVSDVEVLHIENTYNIARKKLLVPLRNIEGTPCCFLENDMCLIYDARPFVCRRHIILAADNSWCSHDCERKFPMLSFSRIDRSYEVIILGGKSLKFYDIREVF